MNTTVLAALEAEGWKRSLGLETVWAVVFGGPRRIPVSHRHRHPEGLWDDHGKLFYRRKPEGGYEYMYVTEPYPMDEEMGWASLRAFCAKHGLVYMRGPASIHGFGTLHIRLTKSHA